MNSNNKAEVALVFGISGDQGQYVTTGLLASRNYETVYGVTHHSKAHMDAIEKHLGVPVLLGDVNALNTDGAKGNGQNALILLQGDLSNAHFLKTLFVNTKATHIFLVTATDLPPIDSADASLHDAEQREYETIKTFFDLLVEVHAEEWNKGSTVDAGDKVKRHVIFSTLDNVRGLVEWLERHNREAGKIEALMGIKPEVVPLTKEHANDLLNMKRLDDGGIVPHYTGKGRGGEYALRIVHGLSSPWEVADLESLYGYSAEATPSIIEGLDVTLITLPFLHSNFTASAAPLPTCSGRATQWAISACLGDPSHPMDMLSVSDLQYIVPTIFQNHQKKYCGRNIRLSAEKITMDEVAYQFADLFGKDVIYSPLTADEMSEMEFPGAQAFSQMCQYLGSQFANRGDVEETIDILNELGRRPQTFKDWLLTHSDSSAFERVGLTVDATPIQSVAVFNATCMQGRSVIKGLLEDTRKSYTIRAICTNDQNSKVMEAEAAGLTSLDPERIAVHYANLDDVNSCADAMRGADGCFVVTNFFNQQISQLPRQDPEREEQEEKRARNVIDACAASGTVRHVVFSTLEAAADVDKELKDSSGWIVLDDGDDINGKKIFDGKTRMAAYARTKSLSITYVLMPLYSESFFRALAMEISNDGSIVEEIDGESSDEEGEKVICMSVYELGPAIANIFDSYEVFAGHEIALMTDILSLREASGIIKEVFFERNCATVTSLEPSVTVIDSSSWSMQEEPEYKLDTYAKDLGSMFRFMNKSEAVKRRKAVAKTMELVPDVRTFRQWLEDNRDNAEMRHMLGIR